MDVYYNLDLCQTNIDSNFWFRIIIDVVSGCWDVVVVVVWIINIVQNVSLQELHDVFIDSLCGLGNHNDDGGSQDGTCFLLIVQIRSLDFLAI